MKTDFKNNKNLQTTVHSDNLILLSDKIKFVVGIKNALANEVVPPAASHEASLVFVSTNEQLDISIQKKAAIIIAHKSVKLPSASDFSAIFATNNIPLAMSLVLPLFDQKKDWLQKTTNSTHSLASIDSSAQIGKNVTIAPFAFIGPNTHIMDDAIIGPGCTIEAGAIIGKGTVLHGSVFIGARCQVGDACEIHPHTTIGSDGFGFVTIENGSHQKIPQIGKVVIENNVEIGANCAIDRATLTETRIRQGTKIDNLVHIAHNCEIGENSLLAAGFMIAGSSKIGRQFMTGGNSVVTGHIEITDNVALAGRSTVTKSIKSPGRYGGYPLEPLNDAMKTIANISQITKMRKQINKIVKHLGLDNDSTIDN